MPELSRAYAKATKRTEVKASGSDSGYSAAPMSFLRSAAELLGIRLSRLLCDFSFFYPINSCLKEVSMKFDFSNIMIFIHFPH